MKTPLVRRPQLLPLERTDTKQRIDTRFRSPKKQGDTDTGYIKVDFTVRCALNSKCLPTTQTLEQDVGEDISLSQIHTPNPPEYVLVRPNAQKSYYTFLMFMFSPQYQNRSHSPHSSRSLTSPMKPLKVSPNLPNHRLPGW